MMSSRRRANEQSTSLMQSRRASSWRIQSAEDYEGMQLVSCVKDSSTQIHNPCINKSCVLPHTGGSFGPGSQRLSNVEATRI